jgi:succinate dehydrogenase flavin-adding protein (antitoxin of CptAB toxin-antitoxin module)
LQRNATEHNDVKHVYAVRHERDKIISQMDLMYMQTEAKTMGVIEPHQAKELVKLLEQSTLDMFNLVHTIKSAEKYKAGGLLDYASKSAIEE